MHIIVSTPKHYFYVCTGAHWSYKSTSEKTFGPLPSLRTSAINREGKFFGGGSIKTSATRCFPCSGVSH
jgi:hypothetical protein